MRGFGDREERREPTGAEVGERCALMSSGEGGRKVSRAMRVWERSAGGSGEGPVGGTRWLRIWVRSVGDNGGTWDGGAVMIYESCVELGAGSWELGNVGLLVFGFGFVAMFRLEFGLLAGECWLTPHSGASGRAFARSVIGLGTSDTGRLGVGGEVRYVAGTVGLR